MSNSIKAVTFLAYPEWCEPQYLEELARLFPVAISPLHDKDVYKSGSKKGEVKKPHWHIIFQGNPSKTVMNYIKKILNSPTDIYTERVHNGESLFQYLTHSDKNSVKAGKAQYKQEDVVVSEKFNEDLLNSTDEESNLKKLTDIVLGEDILEYWQFAVRLLQQDDEELKLYAFKNDARMKRLIDSRRWSLSTKVYNQDENDKREVSRATYEEQISVLEEEADNWKETAGFWKEEARVKTNQIYDLASQINELKDMVSHLSTRK